MIVEGLYLYLSEWGLKDLFDLKFFLTCDRSIALDRVSLRNYEAGTSKTLEESIKRTLDNDMVNADLIENDIGL